MKFGNHPHIDESMRDGASSNMQHLVAAHPPDLGGWSSEALDSLGRGVRGSRGLAKLFQRLTVGHAIAGLRGGAAVTFAQWGRTVFNDVDVANGPQSYFAIERKCLGELGVAAEGELATGTPSGWGTPETFGPMTAVVHRVKGEAQWRRVWAMEAEWTRRIATRGDPACAHPQATIEWRRNGTQSVEVELPFLR